jgi:hypothetical protein
MSPPLTTVVDTWTPAPSGGSTTEIDAIAPLVGTGTGTVVAVCDAGKSAVVVSEAPSRALGSGVGPDGVADVLPPAHAAVAAANAANRTRVNFLRIRVSTAKPQRKSDGTLKPRTKYTYRPFPGKLKVRN